MTEPTDAEIRGLAATGSGVYQDDETAIWEITDPSLLKFARAVLAKWGRPAPVQMPQGWNLQDHGGDVTLVGPNGERWRYREASGAGTDSDFIHRFLRAMLAAAPQPTQAQAQALDELVALSEQAGLYEHDFPAKRGQVREPLTDERIKDEASYFGFLGCVEQLIKFVRAIEAAHGITKEHRNA